MKTEKLPKGRYLKADEIIKKGDLIVYDVKGVFYTARSINYYATCNNLYYRPFKYKPKYRYLKEGEVIKVGDEINCKDSKEWHQVKCWWFNVPVNEIDSVEKIFRRRKHVKVWVE
jgi:hypothetical protein